MLKYSSNLLAQLVIALAFLLVPMTTMAGGVVTEGMTGEDSLTLINSTFGVYTGDQAIAVVSDESDDSDDDNSDETDSAIYLWMSSVFGGHDAAMDPESNVEGDFDSSNENNSNGTDSTQVAAAGGCSAASPSSLGILGLLGLLGLLRRKRN